MRICYFGDFNPDYIRNDVIITGLKENGADLVICQTRLKGWRRYFDLFKSYNSIRGGIDYIVVGSSDTSRWILLFIKLVSRKNLI